MVTVGRVLLQAARDDRLDGRGRGRVQLSERRVFRAAYLRAQRADGRGLKRHAARHHLVEQHAERPDVGALVGLSRRELFGREVFDGADDAAGLRERGARAALRDAEVEQLDLALRAYLYVVRLDVAVYDAVRVYVRDGVHQRGEDSQRLGRRQRAVGSHAVAERVAVNVLHDDAGLALDFREVVYGGDVRVVQTFLNARLVEEAVDEALLAARGLVQDLYRGDAAELGVHAAVDLAHAPLAEEVNQAVLADH